MKFLNKQAIFIYIIILIGLVSFYYVTRDDEPGVQFSLVTRTDFFQEVIITGSVEPVADVGLSFDATGRVSRISRDIGDLVKKGDIIAELENSSILAELAASRARLELERATLLEVLRGKRPEEIAVIAADLSKARQDATNLYDDVPTTIANSVIDTDDAINKKLDLIFSNDNSTTPNLTFTTSDLQLEFSAESKRFRATETLKLMRILRDALPPDNDGRKKTLLNFRTELLIIDDVLVAAFDALNASIDLSDANKTAYKSDVITARTNISTNITAIDKLLQAVASQEALVARYENELALGEAGATTEEIQKQEARINEREANVASSLAMIEKTIIRSPISGLVSQIDMEVGEGVSLGAVVVSVVSGSEFVIKTNITEADIPLVKVGNIANITLDAYGSEEEFKAHVIAINPAENVIEGVSTYKTTLSFADTRNLVRPGMTANINIRTAEKSHVLVIPARAVFDTDGRKFVRILELSGEITEREIVTGLRDSAGNIEVINGLLEGDRVITFIP